MDDKLLKSIDKSLKSIDLSLKKIERNTRPLDPELLEKKKGRGVNPIVRLEGDPQDVLIKVEEGLNEGLRFIKNHQDVSY